jgi:hypothetical protein
LAAAADADPLVAAVGVAAEPTDPVAAPSADAGAASVDAAGADAAEASGADAGPGAVVEAGAAAWDSSGTRTPHPAPNRSAATSATLNRLVIIERFSISNPPNRSANMGVR